MQTLLQWVTIAWTIISPFAVLIFLYLAWIAVSELQKHGYKTTYVNGLLRAVGAANMAAQQAGTTLFTPEGKVLGIAAGTKYLETTVGGAADKLGITDNEARVGAAIGAALMTGGTNLTTAGLASSLPGLVAPALQAEATAMQNQVDQAAARS